MTIAEQLISKGRQQGMQQGMQQAEAKTLLRILSKRFGTISPSVNEQISKAPTSQLEGWIDAALDAESIQQIFND